MSHAAILPDLRPWPEPISASGSYYHTPNGPYVRVTAVEKVFGLGQESLLNWAAGQERAALLEAVKDVWEWGQGLSADAFNNEIEARCKRAKSHLAARDRAADIGSQVHAMIQWRLRGEAGLPPGEMPKLSDAATVGYMAWDDWFSSSRLKVVRVEQVVWDDEDRVAGQLDALLEDPDGFVDLYDWKSSNYLLPKHHIQVAKYLHMARLWRPNIRGAFLVRIPKSLAQITKEQNLEIKPLGHMYVVEQKKEIVRTHEELLASFASNLNNYRVFVEDRNG